MVGDPDNLSPNELIAIATQLANEHPYRQVTRNAFREKTQISDTQWTKAFGTFSSFMEAAGLNTSAGTRKLANQVAKHARADYIRSVSEERLTWGSNFTKPDNGDRWKTIMVASDLHDTEADPFAVRMFIENIRQVQPDVVCINGDLFDLPEFSRHPNDPREWNLSGRIATGLDFLGRIREASPNSQIDLIEGNHEARVIKFLMTDAPMVMEHLSVAHGMDVRKFLRLDEYEVNYVAKGDLAAFTDAQLKKSVLTSEQVYWNFILARHHPPSKDIPIALPGFNGHHHRHEVMSLYNHHMGSYEWHQTGGLHKRRASYTEADVKWNCGYLYGVADTKYQRVNFQYTFVGDTGCQMGGQFYERLPDEYYPTLKDELSRYRSE